MSPPRAPGGSREEVADLAGETEARSAPREPAPARRRAAHRPRAVVVALVVLLAVPLMVALGVLRQPRWYPILDLAQTELRVRDVASADAPLIGLAGRIQADGHQGSHPGPISFFALWPFYQLFGADSWAMQAATVALHAGAMSAALWIAYRRGGIGLVLGVAAVLAVFVRGYGADVLTEAWNPYLPVLWWLVFLLAVWSVFCGDLPLLPFAVFAGSFCAQTHISYVGLTIGLGGAAVAGAFLLAFAPHRDRATLRPLARWSLLAAGVAVAVWLPPVIDELISSPGNFSIMVDYFGDPSEDPVGLRRGVELLLIHLSPWRLVTKQVVVNRFEVVEPSGSLVPGLLLTVGWAATVVVASRLRHRALMRLHLVLGLALVLGALTMSRILGFVWYWLVLWAFGITALMLLAAGWTVCVLVARRMEGRPARGGPTAGKLVLAGVTVVSTVLFTVDAAYVDVATPDLSTTLGEVTRPTVEALTDGSVPGGGREGHYLVTWEDSINFGVQGFGLLNELDRHGFDAGTTENFRAAVTPHRVMDPADATAVVHLAIGPALDRWRAKPGVHEVAYVDHRTPTERVEYQRLRSRVIDELEAAGLSDLVPGVDANLFPTSLDRRIPRRVRDRMLAMVRIGRPTAVFVGPPSAHGDLASAM